MNRKLRTAVLVAVLALLIAPLASFASFAGTAAAAGRPNVELSKSQAGTGGSITVSGSGWRERTLLMILICGQAVPSRGVPGGTNSCANADGRAVTTDAKGGFSRKLPVSEPPVPCPCVVHVATVTGAKAEADVVFQVAGHAVEPLPADTSGGRLSVLTDTALNGSSGLLTWFGAPPARTLVFTVGNVGTSDVRNPVFQVGTAHGVFAPQWDEQQWRGTIRPGGRARIELPVELAAGAHGDYTVSLKYGGKVLAEQPWGVGRPWGVTLFWILVCLVVPAALFRIGMAVVDRVRPRPAGGVRHRGVRLPELALHLPGFKPSTAAHAAPPSTSTLPWFTPDADPGAAGGRLSAPHDDSPTSPATPTSPPAPTSPATPTREGST
ncbi:hypothetical protein [Streptomyces griseorubiginosus]|uniref:Neocarzinostatin family protein n=1 Tax=Streptomyces griseorubiginosus TaxID=67304 RepID=A0A101RQU9_9ACTN|nr:hypothetical protein [Streptomyces griseorubiginosus]KUN60087.1 hypothetical protein AQJ54_37005 [Streptomyces griseorubiginosus]